MTAKDWYVRLVSDPVGPQVIMIHHKGDGNEDSYYTLYRNGNVKDHNDNWMQIVNLKGNDFEYFSDTQYTIFGYIILKESISMDDVESEIYEYFEEVHAEEFNSKEVPKRNLIHIFGTQSLAYKDINGLEIHMMTIPALSQKNAYSRKEDELKCLPFDRNVSADKAIYVTIRCNMQERNRQKEADSINRIVKDIPNCYWVEISRSTVYE